MLWDCLVSGINDDNIHKKLLSEPTLTYTRALEIAQGTEEAEKNIREMRAPQRESDKTGPQATFIGSNLPPSCFTACMSSSESSESPPVSLLSLHQVHFLLGGSVVTVPDVEVSLS